MRYEKSEYFDSQTVVMRTNPSTPENRYVPRE